MTKVPTPAPLVGSSWDHPTEVDPRKHIRLLLGLVPRPIHPTHALRQGIVSFRHQKGMAGRGIFSKSQATTPATSKGPTWAI